MLHLFRVCVLLFAACFGMAAFGRASQIMLKLQPEKPATPMGGKAQSEPLTPQLKKRVLEVAKILGSTAAPHRMSCSKTVAGGKTSWQLYPPPGGAVFMTLEGPSLDLTAYNDLGALSRSSSGSSTYDQAVRKTLKLAASFGLSWLKLDEKMAAQSRKAGAAAATWTVPLGEWKDGLSAGQAGRTFSATYNKKTLAVLNLTIRKTAKYITKPVTVTAEAAVKASSAYARKLSLSFTPSPAKPALIWGLKDSGDRSLVKAWLVESKPSQKPAVRIAIDASSGGLLYAVWDGPAPFRSRASGSARPKPASVRR